MRTRPAVPFDRARAILHCCKLRYLILACLLIMSLAMPTPGHTYEAELRALGTQLVAQLERARQRSGSVLDFTDLQGQGTELGRFLAQELSDQLVAASKTMSFIDRANLQHLLKENKLTMEGLVSPESSRKLGNMIGIDTVIFGTVTPIGKSIRLSVRAVAIETGKIVASQSTNVPAIGDLGELYTRGVPTATASPGATPARPTNNVRDRLRADSFKLIPHELIANTNAYYGTQLNFTIENRSGIGIGIALRGGGTSAGPCGDLGRGSGMGLVDDNGIRQLMAEPDPVKGLRFFPPSGKISATVSLNPDCAAMIWGVATVPLTVNIVVAAAKDVLVLPISADKILVRMVQR